MSKPRIVSNLKDIPVTVCGGQVEIPGKAKSFSIDLNKDTFGDVDWAIDAGWLEEHGVKKAAKAEPVKAEPKPEPKPEPKKEAKPEPVKEEPKVEAKKEKAEKPAKKASKKKAEDSKKG